MSTFSTLLAAALWLALPPASHATAAPAGVKGVVDGVIAPLMQHDAIPGMAVGLIVDGKPYVFTYGVASRATRAPVTRDTLFEIGSVSKTFTATLASLAAIDGHLALTDHVDQFLPALKGSPFGNVTLLELGTHTPGGLPLQVPDAVHDNAQLLQYLKAWRPTCAPEACRTYSNIGIGVLGLIAARSRHQAFVPLMQQRVLAPLGLHNTWYVVPAAHVADYAEGYTSANAPIRMAPGVLGAEAYGIHTSVADMLRFLAANMGLERLPPDLQAAITATHTGYFKAGPMTQDLVWEQYPWPVALTTLLDGNSSRMIFDPTRAARITPPQAPRAAAWLNKTGSTNGFGAYIAFIPQQRLGIILLANKSYPIADRVTTAYAILTQVAAKR